MGSAPLLTAHVESRNGVARIAVSGELDLSTVPALMEQLAHVEQDGVTAIMLDLRDLTFIDSSGLHALLQARDRAKTNGHRLIWVGAGPPARGLFEITGTQFLLDEHEAVGAMEQFTRSNADRPGDAEVAAVDGDV
jgi:anti-anti-sigma factor